MPVDPPELLVPDAAAWRAWLDEHHADHADGVLLVLARKGTTEPTSLTYAQALDAALCFGWIDGQVRRRDAATTFQRFLPRRARSRWSARNVEHVARLTAAGLMQPAGLAEVARAQADGRWAAASAGPATADVPDDLAAALDASPEAAATWAGLSSQNRYAVLFRLGGVRTAAGRARHVAAAIARLERGETYH